MELGVRCCLQYFLQSKRFLRQVNVSTHVNNAMVGVPQLVLTAAAGWGSLYLVLRHVIAQQPEWTVRIVTLVHAVLITFLSTLDWAYIRPWDIQDLGEPNTKYEEAVLSLTLGYFLFDFAWIIWYQTEGLTMYCHHLSSILCVSYILMSGVSAAESLLSVSLLESTNPCLQARWFLRSYGFAGSLVHSITEYVFMIAFLLLRIVYGSHLIFHIVTSQQLHLLFKLGAVSLHIVSSIFVFQMFSYLAKKYSKKNL